MCVTDLQSSGAATATSAGMVTAGSDCFFGFFSCFNQCWLRVKQHGMNLGFMICFLFFFPFLYLLDLLCWPLVERVSLALVVNSKPQILHPEGLIILKTMMHPFSAHGSSF